MAQSGPVVLQKSEPEYPEEARIAAVDGSMRIALVVDSAGNPSDLKVIRPIGFGRDEAALQSIAPWKFKPGMKDGVAVPVETTIDASFKLPDKRDVLHMQSFVCKQAEGAAGPRVVKSEHPSPPGRDETVSATISMDVDERGVPGNLHLVKLTKEKWENDVIAAVREWRFLSSVNREDGNPLVTPCTLSFAWGKTPVAASDYPIGNGGSTPRVITKVQPEFPMEAILARYEGKVGLMVIVDENGKGRDFKVIRAPGPGPDEKAMEAVSKWVFRPGMKDGQAAAVQTTIEVNFRILDKSNKPAWHMESISFEPPVGARRPHVVSTKFPGPAEASDSVTVSFEVMNAGSR